MTDDQTTPPVTFFSQGWYGGQKIDIKPGVQMTYMHARHPGAQIRSVKIQPGYRFRILKGIDGTTAWMPWLEAGDYDDLTQYKWGSDNGYVMARSEDQWVAEVQEVGYDPSALVQGYVKGPGESPALALPPGEFANVGVGNAYWNFPIRSVVVPKYHVLTLWEEKNYGGASIQLEGPDTYDLDPYGWKDRAKSAKLLPDNCVIVSEDYDWDNADKEVEQSIAGDSREENAADADSGITADFTLSVEQDESQEFSWSSQVDVSASMMIGIQATESAGFLGSGASVTEETQFTLGVDVGFGKSGSKSQSIGLSASADVSLPAQTYAKLTVLVNKEKATIKGVRTWKSLRTGETFTENLTITGDMAIESQNSLTGGKL